MTLARHLPPIPPCSPQSRPPGACSRWAGPGTLWHWIRHAAPLLRKSGHLRNAATQCHTELLEFSEDLACIHRTLL